MILHYRTHYATLPANDIFGMVGRSGGGYNTIWTDWSNEGRSKRESIMREYEEGLNAICGHYSKLESSILKEGIRNPVIITCGHPRRRSIEFLPPEMRVLPPDKLLLLEATMGGSRLHIAQKHNINIPCIINDWTGRFKNQPRIRSESEARQCYADRPSRITFNQQLGMVETFNNNKVGYHLGDEWSEDKLMPLRAPLWIGIMNKYGYKVDKLPRIVQDVLDKAGIDQSRVQ
jgi:hypothetical protein